MGISIQTKENINRPQNVSIGRAIKTARGFIMPFADVFYFLFLVFLMWSKSTYIEKTADLNVFFTISAVCLGVKYLLTNWRLEEVARSAALIWLGVVTYITSGHSILLVTFAGIVGAKDVNLKRMLGMCLIFRIALYIVVVSFANMNVIPSVNRYSEEIIDGVAVGTNRYSLGFTMPNAAHVIFLVTAALYIAVNYKKFNFIHAAVITVINIILYTQTDCRTGLVILIVIVVLALLFKIDGVYRVIGKIAPYLFCVCALIGFVFSAFYGRVDFINQFDLILSNRFSYSKLFIKTFGLSVFGLDASSLVSGATVMDVAYVNLAVNYGVIAFALVMTMFTALAYKSYKAGDRGLTVAVMAMALLGMVENYTLDIGINFTLMFAAGLLFPPEKERALFKKRRGGIILK